MADIIIALLFIGLGIEILFILSYMAFKKYTEEKSLRHLIYGTFFLFSAVFIIVGIIYVMNIGFT